MPIIVNLDVQMAKRKIRLNELSEAVGITQANLSKLKTGKVKAVRFSTLEALCRVLSCKPGDILDYTEEQERAAPGASKEDRFADQTPAVRGR